MTAVLLVGTLVAAGGFAAMVWRRHRSVAFAVVAVAVLAHYHLDGLATVRRGSLYISRTYPDLALAPDAGVRIALLATATVALWCVGYLVVRAHGPARPFGAALVGRRSSEGGFGVDRADAASAEPVRLWVGVALLVPLAFAVQRLAGGGLANLLVANRQQVLGADLLGMVVFHAVPAAAALACYAAATTRGWRRTAWVALFAVYLGLALVSGSRSAFLLNVLAPAAAYLATRVIRRLPPLAAWPAARKVGAVAVLVALTAGGLAASTAYRDATRGEQQPDGFFASPDLTQFDALAHVMASDLDPSPTYAAAAVVGVPRAVWADKPLSGNATISEALFTERYLTSRSEVTAGLLGEAWLNARWLGALTAAALLLVLVLVAERLLVTPGIATMLGYVVLFRGLNLVRSDLLNTVVPLVFAGALFWLAARPAVRLVQARRTAPVLVGGAS